MFPAHVKHRSTNTGRKVRIGMPSSRHQESQHDQPLHGPCLTNEPKALLHAAQDADGVFSGRKRILSISRETMGGNERERVLRPKHHVSPSEWSAQPPSAGPTMTAALNWMELRAMALGMSSLAPGWG